MKLDTITISSVEADKNRIDQGDIKALAQSLKDNGLMVPITVVYADDKNFTLIDGRRRLAAARSLGWEKIQAIVLDVKAEGDAESIENFMATISNTHRLQFSPVELYHQVQRQYGLKAGERPKVELYPEIAKMLQVPIREVVQLMRVGDMEKPVVDALASRTITLPLALLSLLLEAKKVPAYLKMLDGSHPSPREAARWIEREASSTRELRHACFDRTGCAKCPKRGQQDAELFADPSKGNDSTTCWDRTCYDRLTMKAIEDAKAKAIAGGLKAIRVSTETSHYGPHHLGYDHTLKANCKVKDAAKCAGCAKVLVGVRDNKAVVGCPSSCDNLKRIIERDSSSGRTAKVDTTKPVIERTAKDKAAYMDEKFTLAARKTFVAHYVKPGSSSLRSQANSFVTGRAPTDYLRILFYLGEELGHNPFQLEGDCATSDRIIKARDLKALAFHPSNIGQLANHITAMDNSMTDVERIDEAVELMFGTKGWCRDHYQAIAGKLGPSALKVWATIPAWRPAWAKGLPFPASAAPIKTPAPKKAPGKKATKKPARKPATKKG